MIIFQNYTRYRTHTLKALCNRLVKEIPQYNRLICLVRVEYSTSNLGFTRWITDARSQTIGLAITLPDVPLIPTYTVIKVLYPALFAYRHKTWPQDVANQEFFDPILRKVGYNLINWPPKVKAVVVKPTKEVLQARKLKTYQSRLSKWKAKHKLATTYITKYTNKIKKLEATMAKGNA